MESSGLRASRSSPCEGLFLDGEVGVEVDLGGLGRLVAEPQCDDSVVDAVAKEIDRRGVPQDVR